MEPIEMQEMLDVRYSLYSLVSRLFDHEVDERSIRLLHADEIGHVCALFADGWEDWNEMVQASSSPESLGVLKSEYTRLLLGPGRLPSSPWESVYSSTDNLLFTRVTLAVRESYRSTGFITKGYPHVADDFIATELSFMSALSHQTAKAYGDKDTVSARSLLRTQARFLDEHLGRWIGSFAKGLQAVDDISDFYPAAACLASTVCREDAQALPELIADIFAD